jgi:hypothetical protein
LKLEHKDAALCETQLMSGARPWLEPQLSGPKVLGAQRLSRSSSEADASIATTRSSPDSHSVVTSRIVKDIVLFGACTETRTEPGIKCVLSGAPVGIPHTLIGGAE